MITRQQHDSGVEKCLGWPLDGRVGMVLRHLYPHRISLPARVWERHVAEERVQRGLVAILAADVVGSDVEFSPETASCGSVLPRFIVDSYRANRRP